MLKLNIGCGDVYFEGWVNIDLDSPKADLKCDAGKTLPYEDNSVDFIFSEHFIEHLSLNEGVMFLQESYRVLKDRGIIRIGTPDMDYMILRHFLLWKKQSWIRKYGYDSVGTNAELMNINFREWGHKYLYNKAELKRRLVEAGFKNVLKSKWGKSKFTELQGLETREETRLILEAVK